MKIIEITHQSRRDIYGRMECEGCGAAEKLVGYDDQYFHEKVMPSKVCKSCRKSSLDLGVQVDPMTPKYPEGLQV